MDEEQEVKELINAVAQSGGTDVDSHFNRYKAIVSTSHTQLCLASTSPHVQSHDVRLLPTPSLQLAPQLTKYQEQPQLLDGSLEGIVQPLAVLLRQAAVASTAQDTARVQGVCRMLHVLVSVRGYKTVVRFFPHEAADLERVLLVGAGACGSVCQCHALQNCSRQS
jgi:hypothetical protein